MTCRQWLAVLLTAQILMAVQPPLAATMRELIDDAKADFEKKDYSAAIKILVPLAQEGHVEAQRYLGMCFENGYGTKRDVVAALSWYELAAESNDADSQVRIGYIHLNGIGVVVDIVSAYTWFQIALLQHRAWENRATAIYYKNIATYKMTPAQRAAAEQAAREWKPGRKAQN